ncbi:hypothetical protein K438DRAFT_231291 [Mycena galopus ATCC 62051]|nr:hypothetical protein K438DRAFT_231291 [Mycena galopus ATCC 62051]
MGSFPAHRDSLCFKTREGLGNFYLGQLRHRILVLVWACINNVRAWARAAARSTFFLSFILSSATNVLDPECKLCRATPIPNAWTMTIAVSISILTAIMMSRTGLPRNNRA